MGVGVSLILKQEMTPGVLIACSLLLSRALAPVEQTISGLRAFSGAREAYRRLVAELDATGRETNRMPLAEPRGAIALDGVGLRLPDRKAPIIEDVSIDIKPGEVVAIIGPSGSGKSTLLRMIAGLQRTTSGTVRIDGTRIADWPSQQIAERVGYLPQDVELFTGSVAENIAGMDPEPDPGLVLEAAKCAHVELLVQQLPEGFNTIVGPHGTGLSGGQRQRLGLARAVYGTRRILLLDEPDAHLDDEGQQNLIRTVIAQKKLGTTVVLTSHRKTMLVAADKVLLMIGGRLIQYGPPTAVLRGLATNPLQAGQTN